LSQFFTNLGLRDELARGLYSYGCKPLTFLQQKCIKLIALGRNVICQVELFKGKRAAVSIGLLQVIDTTINKCQGLFIASTRDAAFWTHSKVIKIGNCMQLKCRICIGGTPVRDDIRALASGVHAVVGTPGRAFDMISRAHLKTVNLKLVVLDDADEIEELQIIEILKRLPRNIQIVVFSETLPLGLLQVIEQFVNNPSRLQVGPKGFNCFKHYYIAVEKEDWKFDTLCDFLVCVDIQVIIFCNSIKIVKKVARFMTENDFVVSSLHTEVEINTRIAIMREFRAGRFRALIVTGNLTKTITHVPQESLIINFDLPTDEKDYWHRIRLAHCSASEGVVVSFVTIENVRFYQVLEQHYNISALPGDLNEIFY